MIYMICGKKKKKKGFIIVWGRMALTGSLFEYLVPY